jgi:hypothetical protein
MLLPSASARARENTDGRVSEIDRGGCEHSAIGGPLHDLNSPYDDAAPLASRPLNRAVGLRPSHAPSGGAMLPDAAPPPLGKSNGVRQCRTRSDPAREAAVPYTRSIIRGGPLIDQAAACTRRTAPAQLPLIRSRSCELSNRAHPALVATSCRHGWRP